MTDDTFPYEQGDDSEPSRVVRYKAEADFTALQTQYQFDEAGAHVVPKTPEQIAAAHSALNDLLDESGADEYEERYEGGLAKASERLEEYFPALTLSRYLHGACPVQAEGFFKNEGIYLRYRSDHATIRILNEDGSLGDILAEQDQVSGDRYRGSMTEQEAVRVFRRLLKKTKKALKQRAKDAR